MKELNFAVDLMKKESRKLLERAEKDMIRGGTELMNAGNQVQWLAKQVYSVEAEAAEASLVLLPYQSINFDSSSSKFRICFKWLFMAKTLFVLQFSKGIRSSDLQIFSSKASLDLKLEA
ncbi:hypothetical protein QYF36_009372 [Acer negundo]|nr:hypothetical protein QYF36_009372 [Acer negundo]